MIGRPRFHTNPVELDPSKERPSFLKKRSKKLLDDLASAFPEGLSLRWSFF
jgi:hypothetical protein